jgi:hypothetical protein
MRHLNSNVFVTPSQVAISQLLTLDCVYRVSAMQTSADRELIHTAAKCLTVLGSLLAVIVASYLSHADERRNHAPEMKVADKLLI